MRLPEILRRQPRWLVLIGSLVLVAVIGWFDYVTGWEWNFFTPYPVPIIMVTWMTGWRPGFAWALLCALAFWLAHIGNNPYLTHWGFALSVFGRWFYFSVLVVAVAALKDKWELDRLRITNLEQMRDLELQVLLASEEEKQRVGRDLHDSLAPHLAALGYEATFLEKKLRQRDQPEAVQAGQIRKHVGDAITLTRELAQGLFPAQTDETSLAAGLEELARTTSKLTGISISFHQTGETRLAEPENGMHLYRIVQEAVNNAAKHGGARKITIILNMSKDSLRLAVADDGKGMAPAPASPRGVGLRSMRYRAHVLGGELKIDSRPGEGTIVSCEIPNRPPQTTTPAP